MLSGVSCSSFAFDVSAQLTHAVPDWAEVPSSFFLKNISYDSDCFFSKKELLSLLPFNELELVTVQDLKRGIAALYSKNKFEKIVFTLDEGDGGYTLHFDFVGAWIFSRLHCKGTFVGKSRYKSEYLLQPGDRFDEDKHVDSVCRIKELMRSKGYLNAAIKEYIEKDEVTKSIDVTLVLDPGNAFIIHGISVLFSDSLKHVGHDTKKMHIKAKRHVVKLLEGESFSHGLLTSAVNLLEDICVHAGFIEVEVSHSLSCDSERNKVAVSFEVKLGKRRLFEFFGNHFFTNKDLTDRLMLFGKSSLFLPPSLLAEELVDLYKNKGYWNVAIKHQEEEGRCFFCIDEGPRSRIRRVVVRGAHYFSDKYIKKIFYDLTRKKFFDKQVQRICREALMKEYFQNGFWDCELLEEGFLEVGPGVYDLEMVIDEKKQRKLRSVSVQGFSDVMETPLFREYVSLKDPIPFDIYIVQKQRRWLLEYFQNNGYMRSSPRPQLHEDEDGVVDLVWKVVGDPVRVRFGKTILKGTVRVQPDVILRELFYHEGDLWSFEKLEKTLIRLRSLGIFEHVSVQSEDDFLCPGVRSVVIQALEDDPFEVRARVGLQSVGRDFKLHDMSFRAGGSFMWKNPTDRADRVLFNADVTGFKRDIVGSYVVPWLLSKPIKTELKGYSTRFDQPLSLCALDRLYRLSQDGISLNFSVGTDSVQGGVDCGFESVKINKLSYQIARKIRFAPDLVDEKVMRSVIEPVCMVTFVDSPLDPTFGSISLATCKLVVPYDKRLKTYARFLFEQSLFFPLYHVLICALRFRGGYVWNKEFCHIIPSDRFYLGGNSSLRGYDTDLAPPVECFQGDGRTCIIPVGGKAMINAAVELRFPVYKSIGCVIFTDCGVLSQSNSAVFDYDNLIGATGFGIRYATPLGPVRFDIGWKWKKYHYEKRGYSWFLTLGHPF